MKLYIAGPMRGYPEFNFPAFYEAQHALETAGYKTFSPAQKDVQRGFQFRGKTGHEEMEQGSGFSIREVMNIDTTWICQEADGVALLPGWQDSKGARAEKALADCLGLPVKLVSQWQQIDSTAAEETMTDTAPDVDVDALAEELAEALGYRDRSLECVGYSKGPITKSDDPLENWHDPAVTLRDGVKGTDEVRIVNETTGGEKGQKLARFDLIPASVEWELAEHYGKGSQKYADRNWEKGYAWSLSYGALRRHLTAFWRGEDIDPDTGSKHMTAVVWHAVALSKFMDEHPELDDRPISRAERPAA